MSCESTALTIPDTPSYRSFIPLTFAVGFALSLGFCGSWVKPESDQPGAAALSFGLFTADLALPGVGMPQG